jgi:hypothetical protein
MSTLLSITQKTAKKHSVNSNLLFNSSKSLTEGQAAGHVDEVWIGAEHLAGDGKVAVEQRAQRQAEHVDDADEEHELVAGLAPLIDGVDYDVLLLPGPGVCQLTTGRECRAARRGRT